MQNKARGCNHLHGLCLIEQAEDGCPPALLELAARCWADDVRHRPTFARIAEAFGVLRALKTRGFGGSDFARCYARPWLRSTVLLLQRRAIIRPRTPYASTCCART